MSTREMLLMIGDMLAQDCITLDYGTRLVHDPECRKCAAKKRWLAARTAPTTRTASEDE